MNTATLMPDITVPVVQGNITEYSLNWPSPHQKSTHELAFSDRFIFVTGQDMDQVAKFDYQGNILAYYHLPKGSAPHGILVDKQNRLWVSLESHGQVVQLDHNGTIVQTIDVRIYPAGSAPINTAPHGIGLDADGLTIWFTGKRTSTIGRIDPDHTVTHFQLNTLAALPIFLSASPDGGMWGTELYGSTILNITKDNLVREFNIPTANSRPIAIIPDPLGNCMWFTEETGVKIGKIDNRGHITEYTVPALQKNDILASLTFDQEGNLWVQVYVDTHHPEPQGYDYIIQFDKSITSLKDDNLSGVPFVIHTIPSRMSMMHRIKTDAEGNIWFTEMMTDKLGKIVLSKNE